MTRSNNELHEVDPQDMTSQERVDHLLRSTENRPVFVISDDVFNEVEDAQFSEQVNTIEQLEY